MIPPTTFVVYRDRGTRMYVPDLEWGSQWCSSREHARTFTNYQKAVRFAERNGAWVATNPHPWHEAPGPGKVA